MYTKTVILSEAIEAHGKKYSSLELRKPNGGDMMECGSPLVTWQDGYGTLHQKPDYAAIGKYLAWLASIPPSSVKNLDPADMNAAGKEVIDFFQEAEAARAKKILELNPPKVPGENQTAD